MILMVCVDDRGGTMFNHRRQSRDKALRQKLLQITQGATLWMSAYSARQFAEPAPQLRVDECFLDKAAPGEFCFLEGQPAAPYAQQAEAVVLFRWNRLYPSDTFFDLDLTQPPWQLVHQEEFAGSSHETITMEVYHIEQQASETPTQPAAEPAAPVCLLPATPEEAAP